MQSDIGKVVVLGTGGTISGRATSATDNVGYRTGEVGVAELIQAVPALASSALEAEQVAQIDSKDMDFATWQRLAERAAFHLARVEVAGVVVTHGTDTLEETAWFLHRVLAPVKPLVLTAAMRPASSLQADGPQNLLDAVTVAGGRGASGVVVVIAGAVHGAADVRKLHTTRLNAFTSGDAGPIARIEEGQLRRFRDWPQGDALGLDRIRGDVAQWPWIAVVTHHAGSSGREVAALRAAGVQGLVVAGTGNATLNVALAAAVGDAERGGIPVRRVSRCALGPVLGGAAPSTLSPWQAAIDLLLEGLRA